MSTRYEHAVVCGAKWTQLLLLAVALPSTLSCPILCFGLFTEQLTSARSGSAPQQSAVAKAERRAARVKRRQLRESRRAGGDVSPDRDTFRCALLGSYLAA